MTFPSPMPVTSPPTEEELYLIRDEIDPLSVRDLEMLDTRARLARARQLFFEEQLREKG